MQDLDLEEIHVVDEEQDMVRWSDTFWTPTYGGQDGQAELIFRAQSVLCSAGGRIVTVRRSRAKHRR